jgi:2',3'-cyclic-nucleotide 2'-phosphodiesterase (5'-nucleotidase family)
MKQHFLKLFVTLPLLVAILGACNSNFYPVNYTSQQVTVNSQLEPDAIVEQRIIPFRDSLRTQMDRIIGFNQSLMVSAKPGSSLTNFVTDVMYEMVRQKGAETDSIPVVDFSMVNIKGLRASLPAGNVLVKHIYEIMPFENEIVIVGLTGHQVIELFELMHKEGGDGISHAGFTVIKNQVVNPHINGKPVDYSKVYYLALSDYVANGGDGYFLFAKAVSRINSGLKIRDVIIEYIELATSKGEQLVANQEKRLVYEH